MSSDLSVRILRPIDEEQFLHDSSEVFSALLNIPTRFSFAFLSDAKTWVGPTALEHNAYFDTIEMEAIPPWLPEERAGTYAYAEAKGIWSLPYVIAASIIITLARQNKQPIIDDGARWIKSETIAMIDDGYDANHVFEALKNPEPFASVDEAATAFYKRLPVRLARTTETAQTIS